MSSLRGGPTSRGSQRLREFLSFAFSVRPDGHVVASLESHPWARVLKASDLTDNGVGLIYTTGPKAMKSARKYAPLVPLVADLIARPDTPLTCQAKARILRQFVSAQQRFAAIGSVTGATSEGR